MIRLPRPSRVSGQLSARFGELVIGPAQVQAVLDAYGLQRVRRPRNLRLSRRSRNVTILTDAGKKVIKLYRPWWTSETVRYGHSILLYLEGRSFPAVRLVRRPDGESWVSAAEGVFAILEFLPGINYSLNYLRRSDRLRLTEIAGRTLARFHRELDGFQPEGAHHMGFVSLEGRRGRDAAWHAAKVAELSARSAELPEPGERARAQRLVARAAGLVEEIEHLENLLGGEDLPRTVIHGDYGLHNLLFQGDGVAVPVDFELSRLDWRINDLISVLGKHRFTGGAYDLESMEAFLGAYADELPLTGRERRRLPEAWRLYKLQSGVQYWNSFFETEGPIRKIDSALDSIAQADGVEDDPEPIRRLARIGATTGRPRRSADVGHGWTG